MSSKKKFSFEKAPDMAVKEDVLGLVVKDGLKLEFADERLKNDKDIVYAALAENPNAFRFVADAMKFDEKVCLKCVSPYTWALQFVPEQIRADMEFALKAVNKYGGALRYLSNEAKDDHCIVLAAVQHCGSSLHTRLRSIPVSIEIPKVSRSGVRR